MVSRKYVEIHVALLSLLLLIGQLGVLVHSVEHSFHTHDQSCQLFLQSESSGDGLSVHALQVPALVGFVRLQRYLLNTFSPALLTNYCSRAPPFLS
ncbi:MAG: DUF2607 family protein [Gammaproteobacteria bacterium]|nr:DUF2607 family protein [Gammaproteobacteria bacterium]